METSFVIWNTKRKSLYDQVSDLAHEQTADLIILIESTAVPSQMINYLEIKTNQKFYYHKNTMQFENGHLYFKYENSEVRTLTEHKRYSIKEIKTCSEIFNLVIVHLPSKNNWGNSADHDAMCTVLIRDIDYFEKDNGHKKSIIVGDFNMNPFENGLINATGLHSVMDREIAETKSRNIYDKEYEFLYNPMWSYLGTKGKGIVNGTNYHNTGKYLNYYWNLYDQILIRPDLLKYFDEDKLEIITEINGTSLTKRVKETTRIEDSISDHLPVRFKLNFKTI